ncbi:LysR family transcriptional regulator [Billgrantia diversa]|uniref:LysR family transcriptional regulator n=1 Tax=Halomonas sp. MCCC 1A13316 TaxID=2733487 RepID=UPI0018A53A4A|nr:LysR family transcriptional regulator [Halomonas sp. MCCC 1A13316]QOR38557.1 LysR family transcriptional regulator [Halomonas sp. MCCC 1A13316]
MLHRQADICAAMPLQNLQLNWLKTFEAVGRHLSFSQAAHELNMSQSAVSQQIKLLENKLGRQLFERQTRSIQLTVAGRAYLGVVREGLRHMDQGLNSIFNSEAQGTLELSVNNTFAQFWLAPRLERFTKLYPRISVRIFGMNWEAEAPPSSAELEIRYGSGNWPSFQAKCLLSKEIRPYCSATLANHLRDTENVLDLPLIDVLGTPNGWSDWLSQYSPGVADGSHQFYVDSYTIAASMAIENVGVCLLNDELVQGSYLHKFLISPFRESIECQASYFLIKLHDRPLSGVAQAFHDWLLEELD